MIKTNNFILQDIKKHILSFRNKLVDRNMDSNFWIIADRADFKPLKRIVIKGKKEYKYNIHSIKEIKDNILDVKGEYYKDKKFADIKIIINDTLLEKLDNEDYGNVKSEPIFVVNIIIYRISSTGTISYTNNSKWSLNVKYCIDDLRTIKFTVKNIEVLMRLAADKVIVTSGVKPISYKKLLNKINSK